MYYMKKDKSADLKSGRTFTYLASRTGLTDRYLKGVFAGDKCKKTTALLLISIRHEISITDSNIEKYLDYYFNIEGKEN